ncbi:FMN-dependent dehydrogenase-domain-containing protein [Armillaria mellea]|nr:FMN-dependent dehydrogenase-domain-containing protein [Armillaria mellea]
MGFTLQQVAEHTTASSCWVIIKDRVYDVTDFLSEHPGGAQIILKYAGKDATLAYEPIHPPDALERNLPPSKHLGSLNTDVALRMEGLRANRKKTKDELRAEQALRERLPLNRILSLSDMEDVARHVLSLKAVSYYSSASDDTISYEENAIAFRRFFFNARVMRPVLQCDPSTTILGYKSSIPVFVSAAGLAKLGHPLGKINITRAAHKASIIQMVSSNASLSYAEIAAAASPSQPLFFQLYKSNDDATAAKRVREVERLGYKAIWLTADAIVAGKREVDIRSPWELESMENGKPTYHSDLDSLEPVDETGTAGALVSKDDQNMSWEKTIPWLRSLTKLPIVIKGEYLLGCIQCVEDAVLAAEAGVDGILLSNHGGRQLDYSMPPLEILYRLRQRRPDIFDKLEVYIDGGIRRGTDVVKALCLGAKAVGLGRPFLYAQSAYGEIGVLKILKILEKEIVTAMKLVGAASVNDLTPDLVERVDWQPLVRSRL